MESETNAQVAEVESLAQAADQETTTGVKTTRPQEQVQETPAKKVYDEDYVKALRQEAAKYRTEKSQLETRVKQFEDAQLTEQERKDRRLQELESKVSEYSQREKQLHLEHAFERAASKEGAIDPDLLIGKLNQSLIEYDEQTGRPTDASLKAAVADLKERYTSQFRAQQEAAQEARPLTGNPANPARSQSGGRWFNESEITDWNFYKANKAEIDRALQEGRIREGK